MVATVAGRAKTAPQGNWASVHLCVCLRGPASQAEPRTPAAKNSEVGLPQAGSFVAGMQKAAEHQNTVDLMSSLESAKKKEAVGSDGCPSEFWKYRSCVVRSDIPSFLHASRCDGGRPECR